MSLLSLSKKILGATEREAKATKKLAKKATEKTTDAPAKAAADTTFSVAAGQMGLSLVLSEKSIAAQARNVLIARVAPYANKQAIAQAVEELFKVKVLAVRTATAHPKHRRRGITAGRTKHWKKAYVTVDDISKINVAP